MYFHIHVHIPPAWNHVVDVQKINYPTSKQAKKQAANQKRNRIHKQTRGRSGQFTSRKEKNSNNHKTIRSNDILGEGSL